MSSGPGLLRGFPAPGHFMEEVAATIGVFDGVHLGHQKLLQRVSAEAGAQRHGMLITFDPHPRCVVGPGGCPPLLTSANERVFLSARHGVGTTIAIDFTAELSEWSPERFIDRLLESLKLRFLVVGPGFALGRARAGDEEFLRRYGAARGFDVITVEPLAIGSSRVSSGRVRDAVIAGDVSEAAALLGRFHHLPGIVVRGDQRGRTLGFPTANLEAAPWRCVPAAGVYATWLLERHPPWRMLRAATSIGVRPTFQRFQRETMTTVEAYVLDFDEDIYGDAVELQFVSRLRDERAYPDAASLVAQMRDDVDEVRALLSAAPEPQLVGP